MEPMPLPAPRFHITITLDKTNQEVTDQDMAARSYITAREAFASNDDQLLASVVVAREVPEG